MLLSAINEYFVFITLDLYNVIATRVRTVKKVINLGFKMQLKILLAAFHLFLNKLG